MEGRGALAKDNHTHTLPTPIGGWLCDDDDDYEDDNNNNNNNENKNDGRGLQRLWLR